MSSLVMESMGWALVHSLWQGTLVALGLAVALMTVGRRAANARYALACGALVLTVVLPVATGWRHATQARATRAAEHAVSTRDLRQESLVAARTRAMARWDRSAHTGVSEREPARAATSDWTRMEPAGLLTLVVERVRESLADLLRWVVLAWVAGVGLSSGRLTAEWVQLRRLARRALPAPHEWQERLDTLSRRLGLSRAVRLLQTTEVDVPSTVGWLSPVVLLPVSALSGLPTRQLEMVLAHELAHIRRHDFAVNLAQVVVETLFFYHPAVRWMSNVIRVEREHCCDDVAVSASGNSVSYARALTALESLRVLPSSEPSHAMSALGGSLPERVRRLVSPPAPRCSSRWVAGASVLTLVSSLAVAAPLTSLVLGQAPTSDVSRPGVANAAVPAPPEASEPPAPPSPRALPRLPTAPRPPGDVKVALPMKLAAAPDVKVKVSTRQDDEDSDLDERTKVGAGQSLSVDQLVALKTAGVTPERVRELESMGYEPTVANLVEMGHMGVTSEYMKQMTVSFGRKLEANALVELRALGITPEYVAALRDAGFDTKNPDDVVEARAVGVDPEYVRGLKAAGYSGMSLEDMSELRAVGVDPAYIGALGKAGLPKLSVNDLQELRAVGVTPEWMEQMRSAGVETKDPDELTELRALGITPDFLRELNAAGLKNLSPDELVRLRAGGVDADFIRRLRDSK
ncbi:M56 family metallopeptidase [Myxococcus llanfairpwllgwyngyllgogerychwyrndrobwllllantysiliogogogochensis]|uniref:M56 family metallopeptidase n=2 Tax=Myxococcus TaxID=32 RepID=A0A540X5V9_9BACT|nr:M56 family metallopeptidase [Myxococcus llanfairpwllgwyngyllgogerychwyrndrobwllllantysiliogogogochensis]TQF16623.1 M56 family metallopeptidase [Myxococcus llanfairpwllgwyngyllgogerychwyrndrobwllllantysiliogogogochensis]